MIDAEMPEEHNSLIYPMTVAEILYRSVIQAPPSMPIQDYPTPIPTEDSLEDASLFYHSLDDDGVYGLDDDDDDDDDDGGDDDDWVSYNGHKVYKLADTTGLERQSSEDDVDLRSSSRSRPAGGRRRG